MHYEDDTFTLGLIQMSCGEDPEANLERAIRAIGKAAEAEAQIVCLQELFLGPYFCQREDPDLFNLAEPVPGPTTQRLQQVAEEHQVVLVASLFERRAPGVHHNTAVVIDANGSLMGLYRKMQIPDDPLYYEKYYFVPGDLGYRAFQTRYAKIGVLVCWDQWYPESARITALKGAEVLFYPTAIGWHPSEKEAVGSQQQDAWEVMQRSHAIANGVYVAAVNRVGHEGPSDGGIEFWGRSFVSDPFGVVLARASSERDEVVIVPCERSRTEDVRRNWPFLRDRRIDSYDAITARWLEDE